MKKYILVTALILSMMSGSVYADEAKNMGVSNNLEELFSESFYEAPSSLMMPDVKVEGNSEVRTVKGMPLFKKTRIKVTNYLRERDYKKNLELQEKEKQELEKQEAEENAKLNKELNINFVDPVQKEAKVSKKSKKAPKEEVKQDETDTTLELEGGVKEQVTSNDVVLDADNVDYDDKTMDIIATGSPVLKFPPQNVTIKADKMIYNKASNILNAYGNVEVIRDGNHVFGDYMQVNMNEESSHIDNLNTKASMLTVRARSADMQDDKIILYNGKLSSEDHYIFNLETKMIGGNNFNRMIIGDEDKSSLVDLVGETAISVKTKELNVDAKKDHDVITLKDAQIRYGDSNLFKFRSLSAHTNKNHEYFEGNYPEIGSLAGFGMYAGPGWVFDTPLQGGSSMKLMPIINSRSGIGIGGLVKYRSATNFTAFGYASAADRFVLRGKQSLDDKLFLQYGSNSYLDEWWFGGRMAKYAAELVYKDQTIVPSTIGKDLDLSFKHRLGIGYMQNSDFNRHDEKIPVQNIGTLRTRYMAEINQKLFSYRDDDKLFNYDLSLVMQGSAALYGTGDTQFVGRIGPLVHTQYKYWMQDIGGFVSAFQDGTPMKVYDMYRYGHANVYLREAFRVNKYLTLAWAGTVTLTGDAPNEKLFQENSFIIAFGPDDFKLNLGYDWVRRQTYFSFRIAMDTKGSSVEFDKMEIKHPDRLAKSSQENVKLKVYDTENSVDNKPVAKKMMYAEVIDIEDPDKEQL